MNLRILFFMDHFIILYGVFQKNDVKFVSVKLRLISTSINRYFQKSNISSQNAKSSIE